MNQVRTLPIAGLATASTFGLFYLMQALIAADVIDIPDEPVFPTFEGVFTMPPEKPAHVTPHIDKPNPPVIPPKTTAIDPGYKEGPYIIPTRIAPKAPPIDDGAHRIDLGAVDGEQIPIVRVQPTYPRRALEQGIEGWTVVEFTVGAEGLVEHPAIIDAQPKGYFETATLQAIAKFKYKPRVIDGRAIPTPGVRYRMVFTLDGDK